MSYDPDEMMLELFRGEVESHSDSLTNSLLKLEQDPSDTGPLDGMMRAAHSIKGAARIVRVDAAVEVAHVMEDFFVAAQRGEIVLQPAAIDILLRSVDLLGQVSDASKNPAADWDSFQPAIKSTVSQLRNMLHGQPLVEGVIPSLPIPSQNPLQSTKIYRAPASQPTLNVPIVPPVERLASIEVAALRVFIPEILNINNAEQIRMQLVLALGQQSDHNQVIVDLSQTKDLDSVGLALIHSATLFAATKHRGLQLENASSALSRIFRVVGIGSLCINAEIGNKET